MSANRALLDRYVERYNAGDLDGVIDLYAEDSVQNMPDGTFRGRAAIRERLAQELSGFTDVNHTVRSFVEEGEFYSLFALSRVDELYPMFYEFYMLTCIYNVAYADCIIDMNSISSDPDKRRLVGEYVGRIYLEVRGRPSYLVRAVYRAKDGEACGSS